MEWEMGDGDAGVEGAVGQMYTVRDDGSVGAGCSDDQRWGSSMQQPAEEQR